MDRKILTYRVSVHTCSPGCLRTEIMATTPNARTRALLHQQFFICTCIFIFMAFIILPRRARRVNIIIERSGPCVSLRWRIRWSRIPFLQNTVCSYGCQCSSHLSISSMTRCGTAGPCMGYLVSLVTAVTSSRMIGLGSDHIAQYPISLCYKLYTDQGITWLHFKDQGSKLKSDLANTIIRGPR